MDLPLPLITVYYILYYLLQNYIWGHIYQEFIMTTHYNIVFYHFNPCPTNVENTLSS
jgi:hypothetical protein